MLANDKVAICKVIARKNAAPRLAALWPEHGSQVAEGQGISVQPGLYLLPLPFADDIRHIPASTDLRASEEAVEAAKEIVKNIQLRDYNPDNYPNPGE